MKPRREPRPGPTKVGTGRGSPEAIEKRRAARKFNQALLGDARASARDGRTERRRRRLLEELASGVTRRGNRELKPIDVLCHVQELLSLGETVATIRKACPKPRPVEATPELLDGLAQIHEAYTFPVEAYAFVGVDEATLRRAGILRDRGARDRPSLRRTKPKVRASDATGPTRTTQKTRRRVA